MQHISDLVDKLCKTSISKPDKEFLIKCFVEEAVDVTLNIKETSLNTDDTNQRITKLVEQTGLGKRMITKIIEA